MDMNIEEIQQLVGVQTIRIFALEKKMLALARKLAEMQQAEQEDFDSGEDTERQSK